MNKNYIKIVIVYSLLQTSLSSATTINDAISQSLNNNPDLITQQHQYNISIDSITKANTGFQPSIDVRAEAGFEQDPNRVDQDLSPVLGSITTTQPLYSGLSTVNDVARAEAESKQEYLRTSATAQKISFSIAQAYLEVLRTQEIVDLSKLNLETHFRLEKEIKERYDQGVSNRADYSQMEGRTALSQSNVIAAVNNLEDARANYEALTGVAVDGFIKPSLTNELLPSEKQQALDIALLEHPLIRAADETINAAKAQYKGTDSPFRPSVDLQFKAEWGEDIAGLSTSHEEYSAKVVVNWNLFQGGRDQINKKIASSQINVAKSTRDRTLRQVFQEARLSWAAYDAAVRQKGFQQDHVDYTSETQKLYEEQFQVNRRTLLDVLDIENELFRARSAAVSADYAELIAKYRLYTSMGRMLKAVKLEETYFNLGQ